MKNKTFEFFQGTKPILVSMPHNGVEIPESIAARMTNSAKRVIDTDWYLDQLYDFSKSQGCYLICPRYNRYVIDLNRPQNDESLYPGQDTTELCPTTQFDRQPIYLNNELPSQQEIKQRIQDYWLPYHNQLESTLKQIRAEFGGALLFEAHSIKSQVPRFFEGKLPDFNFGTNNQQSCAKELSELVDSWSPPGFTKVLNGRFKGGYITRAYGRPNDNIHAIQLELSQATYLNEETLEIDPSKRDVVVPMLKQMFTLFEQFITQKLTGY